jgi:hypothetical protein
MSEDALLSSRRSPAAGEPPPRPGTAAAGAAPQGSAGCFPPRLEISPLTIRPAAELAIDRGLERRPVC